jgi:hypothetical protein
MADSSDTSRPAEPSDPAIPAADTHPSRRNVLSFGALAMGGLVAGCDSSDAAPTVAPTLPPVSAPPPVSALPTRTFSEARAILSEPMLQNPGADSVRVVWFTETPGTANRVRVAGASGPREFAATTTEMSHLLEDIDSQVFQRITSELTVPQRRQVYRHEAVVTGLSPGQRVGYFAISGIEGIEYRSTRDYTLQPLPAPGQSVKILMTSDQQNNRMATANFQKVQETIGPVDAVTFPGDFVSTPNRASEWFDRVSVNNPSYFQSLMGTMQRWNPGSVFRGGDILQYAPLYGCLGNHEYPGRWRLDPATNNPGNTGPSSINAMDGDPQPRWYAEQRYEQLRATVNPNNDPQLRERWIEDNSHEWTTYREMWSLPEGPEGKAYYAQRFGDVFLISLDANRIWRVWNAGQRGKFTENFVAAPGRTSDNPDDWGFGDFTFRPFGPGSRQFRWLQETLASEACRTARFRIVLSHQTMAGLGDNAVPVLAEQIITVELTNGTLIGPFPASQWPQRWPAVDQAARAGQVRFVRYEYPLADDIWRRDIEPLLQSANVQLVHTGHSHLWNRCRVGSLNYLETANVGNSFGAMFFETAQPGVNPSRGPRGVQPGNPAWRAQTVTASPPRTSLTWNPADYPASGEPHGRAMQMPSIFNPMRELAGAPSDLPFVASNVLTAFTVFETGTGLVSSYVYDTRDVNAPTRKFDEFSLA